MTQVTRIIVVLSFKKIINFVVYLLERCSHVTVHVAAIGQLLGSIALIQPGKYLDRSAHAQYIMNIKQKNYNVDAAQRVSDHRLPRACAKTAELLYLRCCWNAAMLISRRVDVVGCSNSSKSDSISGDSSVAPASSRVVV